MSKKQVKREVVSALQPDAGAPIVGHLCWWEFHAARIPVEDFRQLWSTQELPMHLLTKIKDRTALRKALRELQRKKLLTRIKDDAERIVWRVTTEDVDYEQEDVTYRKAQQVIFNKSTKQIEFQIDDPVANEAVRNLFRRYRGAFTARELRKMMTSTIEYMNGVTLRSSGGLYFIARRHTETINKVRQVLSRVEGDNHFIALGILDNETYKASIVAQAQAELTKELAQASTDNKKVLDLAGAGKARSKSVETRVAAMEKLKSKVIELQEFGLKPDELLGGIAKQTKTLQTQLARMPD